jgi:hypothetical protein
MQTVLSDNPIPVGIIRGRTHGRRSQWESSTWPFGQLT